MAGRNGDIASYCLIAAALDHGSVMLVTALQVTVILFALPIYARVTGHRITGREWMWAILLAAALAVVVTVGIRQPVSRAARWKPGSSWHW
ncbi:multidrug resistance efflux transporter family protein [Mycobacterium xenopi 4042]|uniref:Multidrug resistance efflux transporter family protein n=1 Tax=Mycobacterium xenopi 4042 TaxID=1299334 RepID=X8CF93_MYCXE|nr:multidrug resistance efflux transporter family protein [Mycobacterium xenopi 4042]